MKSAPRVQAFTPRIEQGKAQETHSEGEGSQVAVQAHYLPNIYQDGQDKGSSQGQGEGDNQQLVQFLRGANTQQLKTLATDAAKPLFNPDSPLAYMGPNAVAAHYAPKSKAEDNRRHWGDFLPGGSTRAKFLPSDGMDISFDPNDKGINASVPRSVLANSTTVTKDMDFQVRANMYEQHLNVGNPRKDRLSVYSLGGVRLRA